jgi:predicted dehydrogenase
MDKVRLAFLGCGDVAQRDYLPEMGRIAERVELVAVCGRGEERARSVAAQYGFHQWYTDYDRMLAEAEIDAVVNLTPIQLHAETNLAILQAGKHLYTEKPIAGSVAETERLRQEADRRNLVVVSAPCVMIFPQVLYAQSLLQEDAIGPVYSAVGAGHGGVPPWRGYGSDPSQFFTEGGGPARDMGVYPLHALTGLLGPVRRVAAMAAQVLDPFTVPDGPAAGKEITVTVEDNWQLLLDFGNGRLASLEATNCVRDTRVPQMELRGLAGAIAVNVIDVSAPVQVLRRGKSWESIKLPQTGRDAGPDHLLGVEHLVDCIQNNKQPILSLAHALHVVEILEKAAEAAQTGRTLEIDSEF